MNEIKVAENKTLKLTNVLSRLVRPEELGNLPVILTQMQNFMKSNGAQPIGPLVQAVKMGTGPDHVPELYMMQQATQMITQMEPGYHMDAVLRVKNCLYAHYTGPMSHNQLATAKLQIMAFENDIKLTGDNYTIYVNQDDDDAVIDVFMETKYYDDNHSEPFGSAGPPDHDGQKAAPLRVCFCHSDRSVHDFSG